MTRSNLVTPPRPEQIEVSLFGPGFGESVVLHMGFGDWIVVDSCVCPRGGSPAALSYFEAIGVNPADSVHFVIASHWHDDHIRGISAVLDRCSKATFVCPAAVRSKEFFDLAVAAGTRPMMTSPGIREFARVLSILGRRKSDQGQTKGIPRGVVWAAQDRDLWLDETLRKCPFHRQLRALSPSDVAISAAIAEIAKLLPDINETRRSIVPFEPNYAAVALWVKAGRTEILLGADLENTMAPGTGWNAVLNSPARPVLNASTFKIPHHGSIGAHNARVWTDLLDANPYALLTPNVLGGNVLPTATDARRICGMTANAFITAAPGRKKPRYIGVVEKEIRGATRSIREVSGPFGHIRLRRDADATPESGWNIELFGDAKPLRHLSTT